MPRRFDRLDPKPPGFGRCGTCAYRRSGSTAICFTCVLEHTEPNPPAQCDFCGQALQGPNARCLNVICDWDSEERWFGRVRAIAPHSGAMQRVIRWYKYDERKAWGQILGRVLLGYLDERADEFNEYDMIIPMPAYTGPGAHRTWAHIDLIVEHASTEDSFGWPFRRDSAVVVKTADTDTMTKKGWSTRHTIAVAQLRPALSAGRLCGVRSENRRHRRRLHDGARHARGRQGAQAGRCCRCRRSRPCQGTVAPGGLTPGRTAAAAKGVVGKKKERH